MAQANKLEREAVRFYRGLLILYPAEFRDAYGSELCLLFTDRWREERSLAGLLLVWWQAISGILREAPKEHYHVMAQDLRYALRMLRKDAAMTFAAVGILALGIGSTTLVFSLANGLLLRPLPYPDSERLIAVGEYGPKTPKGARQISFPNYFDIRARTRLLEDVGIYGSGAASVLGTGEAERVLSAYCSDGVLPLLGVAPLLGRVFTQADDLPNGPKVVILSEELWQRRWGRDPDILGKTLDTGDVRYTVIGVMPADFHFPDRTEVWFPLQMDPAKSSRTDYFLHAVARLKPQVSVDMAAAELTSLLEQIHRENQAVNNGWNICAVPIRDLLAGSYREAIVTLLAAVGLLLAIACANVSNLLLVKASSRLREMAVRTVLGATRRRLIRQLASESLLLGLAGGLGGVVFAYAGLPALLSLIPVALPRWMDFPVDYRVLSFAFGISLLTSLIFGMAPAFGSSKVDLTTGLKEGGRGGSAGLRQKLRNGLVVGEIAVSVTLLAGAGLMIRSFLAIRMQDLGYRPENVLSLEVSYPETQYPAGPAARALVRRLWDEIAALPGVTGIAFASGVPLHDGWGRIYTIEGRPLPLKDMAWVNHIVVAPGYFQTLGIPLLQGRDFAESDFDAPQLAIVSRTFAKTHWPHDSAIGKRIRFGPPKNQEPWHVIVGVVGDSKHGVLKGEDWPSVYLPYNAGNIPNDLLIRTTADPSRLLAAVKARIASVNRNIAVSHGLTLDEVIDRVAWQDRFFTVLFAVFAALAMLLAAAGLYAVLSYTVSLETHEIGIRMALGASAREVQGLILRQGLVLAGMGLVVGLLAAAMLTGVLQSQLYRISPLDPAAYLAAPALLAIVALVAAILPARRATRVDPMIALRHE